TIELMLEKLTPFDIFGECDDDKTYMQSVITFKEDSDSFDMRTWIRLERMSITDNNPVNDFIRQYGWSIVFFDEDKTVNSTFATIFYDILTTRDSQLKSLRLYSSYFTAHGFNRLDSIIKRTPNFKDIGLYMYINTDNGLEKAYSLLSQYGPILSVLQLFSASLEDWLPWVASAFPTRNCFPNLVSFNLMSFNASKLPSRCVPWIVAMVSAPPQATSSSLHSQSLSQGIVDTYNIQSESESTESWTALRKIMLRNVQLQPKEWKTLMEAIDLSELQHLNLYMSNITYEAFKLLVDRIPDNNTSKMPFKTLNIMRTTDLAKNTGLRAILKELRKKAPLLYHLDLHRSNITREAFKLLVDRIHDNNTSKAPFMMLNIADTGLYSSDSHAVLNELRRKAPLVEIIGTY
ncbi:hypothetical protein BGZ65_008295, partial [Modicella reniformis]